MPWLKERLARLKRKVKEGKLLKKIGGKIAKAALKGGARASGTLEEYDPWKDGPR